jgi:hypothetical protein
MSVMNWGSELSFASIRRQSYRAPQYSISGRSFANWTPLGAVKDRLLVGPARRLDAATKLDEIFVRHAEPERTD